MSEHEDEKSFVEVEDLLKEQNKRHKKVVIILFLTGLLLSLAGGIVWVSNEQWYIIAALLLAIGFFMKIRALLSWFTNIDRQR